MCFTPSVPNESREIPDANIGALAATSALTYDNRGNLLTVDGPLSGTDDTIRYRYDSADQLIGIVGPDPGGIIGDSALSATAAVRAPRGAPPASP